MQVVWDIAWLCCVTLHYFIFIYSFIIHLKLIITAIYEIWAVFISKMGCIVTSFWEFLDLISGYNSTNLTATIILIVVSFWQTTATTSTTVTPAAVVPAEEDEKMRNILAKKEQELLMLQRKKVEMELEQMRRQVELAEKTVTKKVRFCFHSLWFSILFERISVCFIFSKKSMYRYTICLSARPVMGSYVLTINFNIRSNMV